jgi:hypothetical protein
MTIQLILVALVVAAAGLFLAQKVWRTWTARGCAGGCCKSAATPPKSSLIPADELLGRVRQRGSGEAGGGVKPVDRGKSGSFSA